MTICLQIQQLWTLYHRGWNFARTILAFWGIKYYWNATAFERWFKKAPLDELKTARNNIHSEYMKHTANDKYRETLWELLSRLDKKISELEWAGKNPSAPSYPREHGHGLYKPE